MATLKDAQRAVQSTLGTKQNTIEWQLAMTGDGHGLVDAGNGEMYVRAGQNSSVIQVINGGISLQDGVICRIIKPPEDPLHWYAIRATDQRIDENGGGGSVGINIGPHHSTHEYLGVDQVNIDWRQISTLRVYASSGFTIGVLAGLLPRPGSDLVVPSQTLDLTSHVPASGALWALISIDSTGAIVATDGATITPSTSLTLGDIPDTPAGNFRLAAVRLYAGQGAISESTISNDIRDLRWPQEKLAGDPYEQFGVQDANKVLAGPTTGADAVPSFRSLVNADLPSTVIYGTGASPRLAQFSAAQTIEDSTLIKTGAGVLTLDSAGAYTLTVPETMISAGRNVANTFLTTQTITPSTDVVGLIINKSATANAFEVKTGATILYKISSLGKIAINPAAAQDGDLSDSVSVSRAIVDLNTSGATGKHALAVDLRFFATTNSSADYIGAEYLVRSSAGNTSNSNAMSAQVNYVRHLSEGNCGTISVIQSAAQIQNGARATSIYGNYSTIQLSGTGNVTNAYGFYITTSRTSSGQVTNQYGLYITDHNLASTINYSIYTGLGLIRHGDQVAVVGGVDRQQLIVTGHTTQAVGTALVQFTRADAAAGVSTMLGLTGLGSGANGDGIAQTFSAKSSTTAAQLQAQVSTLWSNSTHANRTSDIVLYNVLNGTAQESLRLQGATNNTIAKGMVRQGDTWHAYGGFQLSTTTIACTQNVWAWVTNAGHNLWTAIESSGVTVSGDIFTAAHTGDYTGQVVISITGTNGRDFFIRVFNITTNAQMGYTIGATTTGNPNFTPITLPLYMELTAGDTFRFEIENITDNADPDVRSAVYNILYVHD